jgi:drug/metabolite transporter (DMT)-like permease
VLAALLWSTSGLFVKTGAFNDWPADQRGILLAFWRALFAAVVLAPFVRRPRWRAALVPMGLAFGAMNATYLCAMVLTTAANAIWLQSTAPLWIFVLGRLLLRESGDPRDLAPLGFAAAGIGVILWFEAGGQDARGVLLGLAAGVCYGAVVLCLRRLRDEDPVWLIALNHAFAALAMLPYVVSVGLWPSAAQLVVLAAFGAVQMAIPYVIFVRGLRHIGSQEAAGIGLLEPLLVPLWVYFVAGESPAWWTLAGGALILAGLALRYVRPAAKETLT